MTDEEKKALEQARSNITRGNDIESAMLILEKCVLEGVIFIGGRLNIFKIAVRQILNFLEEYKDKGYLDVVREKVKANETVEKQSKEIELLKEENEKYKNPPFFDEDKYTENDKIKAKIEEVDYKMIAHQDVREAVKQVLQSLLEKE